MRAFISACVLKATLLTELSLDQTGCLCSFTDPEHHYQKHDTNFTVEQRQTKLGVRKADMYG